MKVFLISPKHIDKLSIAKEVVALDDNINICKRFTSNIEDKNELSNFRFFMDVDDTILAFKNNVLLYLEYRDDNVSGITLDDYEASDIILIDSNHFNEIPDIYLANKELLFITLYSKTNKNDETKKQDIIEDQYIQDRSLELNIPIIYFIDEAATDIANIIIDYIKGDEEIRERIIQENS